MNKAFVPQAARRPVVGVALGAGAARGWCHIGVLRELALRGVAPDVIAGTSIGAVIGGCCAAGDLDGIERFARSLTKRRVFALMDLSFGGGGLLSGVRLQTQLEAAVGQMRVEDLPVRFGAVATEIGSGHEIWLTSGALAPAIRASYALPGLFEPVELSGRWLFDGALVNPVPVTLCRALGADVVIAVNIITASHYRGTVLADRPRYDGFEPTPAADDIVETARRGFLRQLRDSRNARLSAGKRRSPSPGFGSVVMDAFNITQDRIARSRLAGDPPDVTINARLDGIGLFDFHRADELIALGREAARKAAHEIADHLLAAGLATGAPV